MEWNQDVLETMRDRLNDQSRHIEDAVKVITRYKDELQDIRKDNIGLNQAIDKIHASMDEIRDTQTRMKGRMLDAAKSGRIEDLGGDAVNE
jgi:chromosome segregation ATPase